jgi:hypothetical protein
MASPRGDNTNTCEIIAPGFDGLRAGSLLLSLAEGCELHYDEVNDDHDGQEEGHRGCRCDQLGLGKRNGVPEKSINGLHHRYSLIV